MLKKDNSDENTILGFTYNEYMAIATSDLQVNFLFEIAVKKLIELQNGGKIDLKCHRILLSGKRKGQKGIAFVHIDTKTVCIIDKHVDTQRVIGNDFLMRCNLENGVYKINGPTIVSFNLEKKPTSVSATIVNPSSIKALHDLIVRNKIEFS